MSKMYEALKMAQEQGAVVDVPELIAPERLASDISGTQPVGEDDRSRPGEIRLPGSIRQNDNRAEMRHLPIQVAGKAAVIPWSASASPGGEQYRIIRTRIVQQPTRPKVIVVSSACSGDGKTVSAINIAGVLSLRDNTKTLLIDGDFRRAGVSSALGLPLGPGLSDTLSRSCTLQDTIVRVDQFPNFYVMTAGNGNPKAAELLDSDHWKALCATVREHFDFVVIDAPPIAAVADYELIQARSDGVILVVRPDHTDRTLLDKALDLVPDVKRLGVVINCSAEWFLWKTHESYYYYSGSKQ
jgi:capsular exopolysaccharide synthesis family protein